MQFEFNSLNLLDNVKQNGAVKARYIWTVDGAKRAVADAARSNGFEYLGSLVYARMNGVLELESANLTDGRIAKTSNGYDVQYYYKDHLESVRFVDGQYGRDDYMPYGSRMQADGYATSSSRTKFSGKEMQTLSVNTSTGALAQLGLYDFGARMYDPVTARWLTQDPLAEKYYEVSPYVYCGNNPINRIDPDGMDWYEYDETYKDDAGNTQTKVRYAYNEKTLNDDEMKEKGYNKNVGLIHVNKGMYYSLKGDVLTGNSSIVSKMKSDFNQMGYSDAQKNIDKAQSFLTHTLWNSEMQTTVDLGIKRFVVPASGATYTDVNSRFLLNRYDDYLIANNKSVRYDPLHTPRLSGRAGMIFESLVNMSFAPPVPPFLATPSLNQNTKHQINKNNDNFKIKYYKKAGIIK